MNAIIYLLKRNLINSLKELKKKPLKLIMYLGIIILIITSLSFSIKNKVQILDINLEIYRSIFLGIIIIFLFLSLKVGIEKGGRHEKNKKIHNILVGNYSYIFYFIFQSSS